MIRNTATTQPAEAGSLEGVDLEGVREILRQHEHDRGGLIAILEAVQVRYGYLPEAALRTVADETGRPLVDVFGVATFYRFFTLKPRGKHLVCACLGTACHVRGAARIVEEFERQLGIPRGETTPDKQFTLETVNCLGACALGPVVVIDGRYFSKVRRSRVRQMLDDAAKGFAGGDLREDGRVFPIDVSCPRCNRSLMDAEHAVDGLPSIRLVVAAPRLGSGQAPGRQVPWLLSSLYGSPSAALPDTIPVGTIAEVFCPHCHAELAGRAACTTCGAPMLLVLVRGGGVVQMCRRQGCRERRLDLDGVNL
ncbi:MAG TPA: NAD(P)H-dependent oxidoreductase subunit E [Phycisphaerae bacterium]|nr:NAD(P)H-dependent oxidoreductase subunit E [Phycisphaerae bacterium]